MHFHTFQLFAGLSRELLLENLNILHILYMKARGSMGDERTGKPLVEGLAVENVFSAANTLNVNGKFDCLHCFNANKLICVQVVALRQSKCRISHTIWESLTQNIRPGGVAIKCLIYLLAP